MTIILTLVVISIAWSLYGYFGSRVEQADYTVIRSMADYEIREYPAHIVAETTVTGARRDALNQGFRIVAGYIFGGNSAKKSIAMTAPVTTSTESEKIAMTAPVLAQTEGTSTVVAFGMPRMYTLESLPVPSDSRIRLVEVPLKYFAVIRFSWFRNDTRITSMEEKLRRALTRDFVTLIGSPTYAGYNAPWTPPWMNRNEILQEIAL